VESSLDTLIDSVLQKQTFSEEAKRQTEWVIADTVAAALYGVKSENELLKYIRNISREKQSDSAQIPVLGTNVSSSVKDNLIIHGTAIVSNELDEGNTFAKGHPSAHIFPTLFAVAWENKADIDSVIMAYIKAYEISSRFANAAKMYDKLHPHGTWGNAGGAVAKALIEGKTKKEIKQIILLTLSLPLTTSWLAAEEGQKVRNLYTGLGSFFAYEATNLVDYGFASNISVTQHLWSDILGEGFEEERLYKSLFNPPMIQQNYMKEHPACRFTHAAIDAAELIRNENDIDPSFIKKVTVDTYNLAARCDVQIPKSKLQAKFSIPYAVACTLMGKNMFENYQENLFFVKKLAEKIVVNDTQWITDMLPQKRAANVTIEMKDGHSISRLVENAKGEYFDALREQDLWIKYENMLSQYYSDAWLKNLKENLLNMRNHSTFAEWVLANKLIER